MNTPAHALVNLLLLARKPGARAAIVAGALIADLAMVVHRWHLLLGTPEQQIWPRPPGCTAARRNCGRGL